jgi:hypothetical protein
MTEQLSAAQKEIARLKEQYNEDVKSTKFNILLTSESGHGKTFLARTAPPLVHIDSFDPGGTKCLQNEIKKGKIIVDSSYEKEDPLRPSVYLKWKKEFQRRVSMGYFKEIETYVLDSSTTWAEAIMNWVLAKDGVAGQAPRFTKDYTPQKVEIRNMLRLILDLPCHVIVTGHLKLIEDEHTRKHKFRYFTTGQGAVTIPLLFDELWTLITKTTGDKTTYKLLLQANDAYLSRSRLAGDGLLGPVEEPDFSKLLEKVKKASSSK